MPLPLADLQSLSDFMRAENLALVEIDGDRIKMVRAIEALAAAPTRVPEETPEERKYREHVEEENRKSLYERGDLYGGAVPYLSRDGE